MEALRAENAALVEAVAALRRENMELKKRHRLRQEIREIFADANGGYGYQRLHAALKGLGRSVSEKVIRRLMKAERLIVPNVKRRGYGSYMGETSPAVENVLRRNFHADRPNVKWVTRITEFRILAGRVYLSPHE